MRSTRPELSRHQRPRPQLPALRPNDPTGGKDAPGVRARFSWVPIAWRLSSRPHGPSPSPGPSGRDALLVRAQDRRTIRFCASACVVLAPPGILRFQEEPKLSKLRKVVLTVFAVATLAATFPTVAVSGGGACSLGQAQAAESPVVEAMTRRRSPIGSPEPRPIPPETRGLDQTGITSW
jgi:hypothetical protein